MYRDIRGMETLTPVIFTVDDPIAIVGIGLRLPGSIRTPRQYWEFLINKGSGRGRVPESRYNVDAFIGPKGKAGHAWTEYGYFLEDVDLVTIDSSFWSMSRKEIELMDPQQRLMLEVAYECLESSGTTDFKGKDIGCYIGCFGEDWADIQAKDSHTSGMYRISGYSDFAIANRVSYEMGFTGPSTTTRTACSSSLTALYQACQALYAGECSAALVGGCNMILSPHMTIAMTEQGVISPSGYCRSFDANADGYARGEAINAIYIKKLSHAIHGKTAGMSLPSPESHEALIRRSHRLAGITDLSKTAMIECHGTATAVGDPLEARAVAQVFGEWGILIGSVKSNIGHSEGASRLSSVVKMVLALENQTIPPNVNFTTPNPKIPFHEARLRVPVETEPWPRDKHEVVGINSFGVGGANAHVLLESARSVSGAKTNQKTNGAITDSSNTNLLVFSGTHSQAVSDSIANNLEYVSDNPLRATDLSYTLACRRERFPHRAFAIGSTDGWDISQVQRAGPTPDMVWVFTGQGAQYPGMGSELVLGNHIVKDTIRRLDKVLAELDPARTWTLEDELLRAEDLSNLSQAQYAQPCCTAIQLALVDLLKSFNVSPSAVVGHSSGEIAAAYAAGPLSAEDAIIVAYQRGQVSRKAEGDRKGGMMAVGLGREQVSPFLAVHVTIACENSPSNITLSGDSSTLDTVGSNILASHPDVLVRRLRVNCAYHSEHMKQVEDEYIQRLAGLHVPDSMLSTVFVSSVTAKVIHNASELGSGYWRNNLTSPVLFHSAVANLLSGKVANPLFLEIGPHSALSGPLREIAPNASPRPVPYDSILHLSSLCPGALLTDLPTYPWHYEGRFWSESRVSRSWRFRKYPHHDLLGSRITDGNENEPTWRSIIHLDNVPWIRGHIIGEETVFPGAGYLTGHADFTVRKDPLTEVVTQFRPSRVTVTLDSEWYDFTIMSLLDGVWTKNCTGQARGGLGLNYGPRFRGLKEITASLSRQAVTAELTDSRETEDSFYSIHHCTIDCIFQLFSVAGLQGLPRHFNHVHVPTYIEELYLCPPSGPITASVSVEATAKSEMVFHLRHMRLSLLHEGEEDRGDDPHAGARLVWRPDIDEVDIATLMRPMTDISDIIGLLTRLAFACMVETEYQVRDITPSLPHYTEFYQWLRTQLDRPTEGVYDHISSWHEVATMSSADRTVLIDELYTRALETDAGGNSQALFEGTMDALALLVEDDLLTKIYNFSQVCVFRVFGHNRPTMRVLEVGAGTGGVTATILPALQGPRGERMYGSYTYTDISAGFLNAAQERFKDYSGIIYRTLDITADPVAQGFEAGSFDLIIASNALHVTASLQSSLSNVKTLLKPNGKLFLQELAPTTKWINYVMGTLPGWWLGGPDGRPCEPYVSPSRWALELRQAGLSGADAVVHDGHINAQIVSSAGLPRQPLSKRVTVLCKRGGPSKAVDNLVTALYTRGYTVDTCFLGEQWPAGRLIISVLELEDPLVHSLGPEDYCNVQQLITSLETTPLLWVTRSSQIACSDPRFAPILGLLRTARMELSVQATTLELDSLQAHAFRTVVTVAERLLDNTLFDPTLDPITEYVYAEGILRVGKFYPADVGEELLEAAPFVDLTGTTLHIDKPGLLQTLSWKPKAMALDSVPKDWVEVQPCVVGLNFRDLLMAMGIVDSMDLGGECAGVVRNIGPEVKNTQVGDRVIVFAAGAFATRLVTTESLCARMARGLNWAQGATMPCVFATVLYSLIDVARLKHGGTVLIHSACGGIGLAAIQVSRMLGAKIYCTVGSDAKVEYLVQMGIPRERIFHSRDKTFLRDVLAATEGQGVDVVLNSLSGELLHTSWQCVAEFGTLVELGKHEFIGKGYLAMEAFRSNRTFTGVDLALLSERRPDITQGLLRRCMHHFALGELSPLPVHEFEAQHVEQPFRYMQKGTHIGKIAVTMPDDSSTLPLSLSPRAPSFRSDACHLIVGGLGGLGRSVSSWMSHHGGNHFIFFSRSAGDREQDNFVLELRAQGCRVDLVSGDVSNDGDVDALMASIRTPLAGVMQASMALEDKALVSMSFEEWQTAFSPKVQGTWNLHRSLEKHDHNVDYFVLFSSGSGLIGRSGQANYAAGNTFLDAFVQYRHSLHRPCSALNIGAVEDVGYVSQNKHVLDHFHATSTHTLHEQDLLDTIQLAIENSNPPAVSDPKANTTTFVSHSQISIGMRTTTPLSSPGNRSAWKRDPRMALYHNLDAADGKGPSTAADAKDNVLEQFLRQAKLTPKILTKQSSTDLLAQEIGRALFNFMLRDHSELDYDVPLPNLGVDSLLAIELRNWFRLKVTLDVTVLEIVRSGSLRKLGQMAANNLAAKLATAETGVADKAAAVDDINARYLKMKAP
ncbi:beta-ketoacyl synthase [Aspergillus californicus]